MREPTIIRGEKNKQHPYAQISRKALRNPDLRWKDKGLLAYLLSLPADWQIYLKELPKHCKDGIKSTRSAFRRLEDVGHITKKIRRDEKGRFIGFEYVVREVPVKVVEKPKEIGNYPRAQKRHADKGTLLKKDLTRMTRYESDPMFRQLMDETEAEAKR